jgi:hypothetical protein
VTLSGSGRVGGGRGCPTVAADIVSSAGIEKCGATIKSSAPHDHFAVGQHCGMKKPGIGRIRGARGCPAIGARIVSPACVEYTTANSAPDDHFGAGPDCCVGVSACGRVGGVRGRPTVGAGIVSASGVKEIGAVRSAPHDHFALSHHCRVKITSFGRVSRAGG